MISKMLIALLSGSVAMASYSANLSIQSVEGAKVLDGSYQVSVNKNTKTYSSKNGEITGKKIFTEKTFNRDGRSKTFKSEQLITKGGQQYTVHFLGRQEGGHEHGYVLVKKGNKVLSRGFYHYNK
jgi:hypothetical protein